MVGVSPPLVIFSALCLLSPRSECQLPTHGFPSGVRVSKLEVFGCSDLPFYLPFFSDFLSGFRTRRFAVLIAFGDFKPGECGLSL